MKELVVISGKGGTGKTSIVASFAALADGAVLADCDVDAADLHLVLSPRIQREHAFSGGKRAAIIAEKCTGCGQCFDVCRFDAVKHRAESNGTRGRWEIDPVACEGCGVCAWFCPDQAIDFSDAVNGHWYVSETRYGAMVHAKLGVAEENSGKLVTLVRNEARKIAERDGRDLLMVDGSPGIGCPVIASITGADLILVVTEPTVSGEHDLERVAELAKHFQIPALVCVNKADLNDTVAGRIRKRAEETGILFAGAVRYDKAVTQAQIAKSSVIEYTDLPIAEDIRKVWRNVSRCLEGNARA